MTTRSADPLFYRHDLMLLLGRLDMYISDVAVGNSLAHPPESEGCDCCVNGVDKQALAMRARIVESLSAIPA